MTETQKYTNLLDEMIAHLVLRKCQVAKAQGEAYALEPENPRQRDWEYTKRIQSEKTELSAKLETYKAQLDK